MDEKIIAYQVLRELSADALNYFFPGLDYPVHPHELADLSASYASSAKEFPADARLSDEFIPKENYRFSRKYSAKHSSCAKPSFFRELWEGINEEDEDEIEEATVEAFMAEIEALQRKYGISIERLEALLSYRVKLSHLRVTRHKRIILDDFNGSEVKMEKLTKAVFLLFLKHPEGIRYKELCDYRQELEDIYMSISGRSDTKAIKKSLDDLVDTVMSNSINEKVSKVKKAFRNVVDDRIARFYYIDGKQGEAKRIALDPSLVIWE